MVHVVDKKSGSVDGAWELAPNLKELRLRHLEPERVLVVTVDPAVKALNNATFGKSYEKRLPRVMSSPASALPAGDRCYRGKSRKDCRSWRLTSTTLM